MSTTYINNQYLSACSMGDNNFISNSAFFKTLLLIIRIANLTTNPGANNPCCRPKISIK